MYSVFELLGIDLFIVESRPVLYIKSADSLVVADIHLGYEDALASQGLFLPKTQLRKALKVIKDSRDRTSARRLIINGDIKHAFDRLTRQERVEVENLLSEALDAGFKEIIFIRGNHDNYVTPILRNYGVTIIDDILDIGSGVVLTHGHLDLDIGSDYIIIGHEHPAVQLDTGGYREKFKALLLIPTIKDSLIIVIPALGEYQVGNTITLDRGSYLSPITRNLGVIEDSIPIIVDQRLGVQPLIRLRELYAKI